MAYNHWDIRLTETRTTSGPFSSKRAQIGEYSYGSSGVSFDHVVLRSGVLDGGYVDDFRLSSSTGHVPDAASTLGLIGISIVSLALMRRRVGRAQLSHFD